MAWAAVIELIGEDRSEGLQFYFFFLPKKATIWPYHVVYCRIHLRTVVTVPYNSPCRFIIMMSGAARRYHYNVIAFLGIWYW
jgi:hypothetical protein